MFPNPHTTRRAVMLGMATSLVLGPTIARAEQHEGDTTKLINDLIHDLTPRGDTSQGGLPVGGPKSREVWVTLPDGTRKSYWVDYDSSASLSIHFRTDSAVISSRSGRLLRVLATALKSRELSNYSYMLAGHTDARASHEHNQGLSERRAVSVLNHLTDVHDIDGSRLIPVGFGESQLRNPSAPNSGINRRVEVGLIVRAPGGTQPVYGGNDGTNSLIGD